MTRLRPWLYLILACIAGSQWILLRALGIHPAQPWTVLLPGMAIVGAAFLVTWAAEAAEMDVPQSISIALVAFIAVMPEYAVDIYFAWTAGKDPTYISFATANMTGANRLLIGVGWPAVLLACWYKHNNHEIHLPRRNGLEIVTLMAATLYSFLIPLKASLSVVDTFVLLALFGAYAWLSTKAGMEEPELMGIAQRLAALPKLRRRVTLAALFSFSALAIILAAEPFAEGILDIGRQWGIEEFILVQWLAPLASEAPEFIVAIIFALKGKPAVGLRTLISSKVNQWTLLVGMIPLAYCLSAGKLTPMPMDARQVEEIFLTSAQSMFGIVLIMNLVFSKWEALALFILFSSQLAFPQTEARYAFAGLYVTLSVILFVTQGTRRQTIKALITDVFKA